MTKAINRFTDYLIVWSPDDKDMLDTEHKDYFIKILKKNTIKYSVCYETGEAGTNPHLDIVAVFKNKQTKNDVLKKINRTYIHYWDLAKSGPLVINHITDWKYRLGYNLKEGEQYSRENITDEEQQLAIEHYETLNKERSDKKELLTKYKYVGQKNVINTIHRFKLLKDKTITSSEDLYNLIKAMAMDGYYFDINHETKRKIFNFILANETQDSSYITSQLDEWILDSDEWSKQHYGESMVVHNFVPTLP